MIKFYNNPAKLNASGIVNPLTTQDVAEILNLTPDLIRHLIYNHELPAFRVGNKKKVWLIQSFDLEQWISRMHLNMIISLPKESCYEKDDNAFTDNEEYSTPKQLGELLNMTPANVRRLIRLEEIPAIKAGNSWLIEKKQIEEIIKIFKI